MYSDDKTPPTVQVKRPAHQMERADDDGSGLPRAWQTLTIDRSKRGELVSQLVTGVVGLIETGALSAGERLPSVRRISKALGFSTFTIAEAYNRLVADGLVLARPSAGYFVNGSRTSTDRPHRQISSPMTPQDIDPFMAELYSPCANVLPLGAGWLPSSWHATEWMQGIERQAIRLSPQRVQGYGHPLGLPELRELIAHRMPIVGMPQVDPSQILLTRGATHAFDLVLRTLTRPGDAVMMEEPGYPPLAALIEQQGCRLYRVPRHAYGIDLKALDELSEQHTPKLFFVQTVLQNPLGTTLGASDAHHLVNIAEKRRLHLIDIDVCRDLARAGAPSLAALDGLQRVIRVDSTSKTLSPQFRVGAICASNDLIKKLSRTKMVTGLPSAELDERIVKHALASSEYRRMVTKLQTRLALALDNGLNVLEAHGMEPLVLPQGGFFISAGFSPRNGCATKEGFTGSSVTRLALDAGLLFLPGRFFMGEDSPDPPWFRFNLAWIDHPRVQDFFKTIKR